MKVRGFKSAVKKLPACLESDKMSGMENFGLHCFANSLVQCVSNFNGVLTQMHEHNDRHEIPGKS